MKKVMTTNSFFAHPENIVLSMLADERVEVRKVAVKRVLHARRASNEYQERNFELPRTLNINADDYTEMLDWEKELITSPPLLSAIDNTEVIQYEEHALKLPHIPCHSQSIERCVDIVTKASSDRSGHASRHRFILNLLESREMMPRFDSKCQYSN